MNIRSKKQKENLLENLAGVSVKTVRLDNEYGSWLREIKLLQRAKEASSCRAGGIKAAPGSRGTERRTTPEPRRVACSLLPVPRALPSGEESVPPCTA